MATARTRAFQVIALVLALGGLIFFVWRASTRTASPDPASMRNTDVAAPTALEAPAPEGVTATAAAPDGSPPDGSPPDAAPVVPRPDPFLGSSKAPLGVIPRGEPIGGNSGRKVFLGTSKSGDLGGMGGLRGLGTVGDGLGLRKPDAGTVQGEPPLSTFERLNDDYMDSSKSIEGASRLYPKELE